MPSSSLRSVDLNVQPDLHPLYPSTAYIAVLLSSHSGLTPDQKAELVKHCLARSCIFAELSVLQYLLSDSQAQTYVDLSTQDEDGQGLISLTIHGFGADSDRDVEREECVRLLIAQGAHLGPDKSGYSLHVIVSAPLTAPRARRLDPSTSCSTSIAPDARLTSHDTRVLAVRRIPTQADATRHRYRPYHTSRTRGCRTSPRRSYARRRLDWRTHGGTTARTRRTRKTERKTKDRPGRYRESLEHSSKVVGS